MKKKTSAKHSVPIVKLNVANKAQVKGTVITMLKKQQQKQSSESSLLNYSNFACI